MNLKFLAPVAAVAFMFAASAQAATTVACDVTDISPAAQACVGFSDGNLLNNAHIQEQKDALATLGFVWDGTTILETISPLNGSHTVDFTQLLQGITYIGMHFGNAPSGPGEATAFYRLDAGSGLDQITLKYGASSNAVLYFTGSGGVVPEPASWAMMIVGLGGVGAVMRRRRTATAFA
jgi:hypothetical protein